jgi:hypothetical protein
MIEPTSIGRSRNERKKSPGASLEIFDLRAGEGLGFTLGMASRLARVDGAGQE